MTGSVSLQSARTRVKICGFTTSEDARAAIGAGADALGFNTYRGSKRYLDLAIAGEWIANLPAFVDKVAVMVNPTIDEALAVAALPFIDTLQFHGDESPEFCRQFAGRHIPFIKAIAVGSAADLDQLGDYHTSSILLDASVAGQYGGTGKKIDWQIARQAVERYPELQIILSGGLFPANVRDAVVEVAPYAVDVASGVESSPGVKNTVMMGEFVEEATC